MEKRIPWVIAHPHYEWDSHRFIVPAILDVFGAFPSRVEWIREYPIEISEKTLDEIRQTASCLILTPPLANTINYAAHVRRHFGLTVPWVIMETSYLNMGGLIYVRNKSLLRSHDVIVSCASPGEQMSRDAFPGHRNIARIPYPVDENIMTPLSEKDRRQFRESLALGDGGKMLVYTGRVTASKNIHGLLKAVALARKTDTSLRLFILGAATDERTVLGGHQSGAEYMTVLQRIIGENDLNAHVRFMGHLPRDQVRLFLASCHAHLSASLFYCEEYGYSVAEGLMCGAPTAVSAWGGFRDMVRGQGALGIPVTITADGPTLSEKDFARGLVRLLDPAVNGSWRNKALKYARDYLTTASVARQWQKLTAKIKIPPRPGDHLVFSRRLTDFYLETVTRMKGPPPEGNRDHVLFSDSRHQYYRWALENYAGVSAPKSSQPQEAGR